MGYREKGDVLHEMHPRDVAKQRAKIGMVFQRFNLLPTLSAHGNIALASHIAGNSNGSWEKEKKEPLRPQPA